MTPSIQEENGIIKENRKCRIVYVFAGKKKTKHLHNMISQLRIFSG